MMNKRETLIKTLRGSVERLNDLAELTEGLTVMDETDHVDTDFLMEALDCVNAFMNASNMVVMKISSLLAPDAIIVDKKKQDDEGKKWSVEEILRHCTLENNILKLPSVLFNKKSYAEAKKWIEEAGGSWQSGKTQGFTFPFNPERVFSILKEGKRCNLQQDFQFFETPDAVADWLVMLAGGIHEGDTVLEPSAGAEWQKEEFYNPPNCKQYSQTIQRNYCDDCVHFRPDEGGERKPVDELCEFVRPLEFKMPSTGHDFIFGNDWGFYLPGCKDYKLTE